MINKPNRFAAIDIGTNSFHLLIVEVNENGKIKFLDKERVFFRLGTEFGKELRLISNNEIDKTVIILKNFLSRVKHYKADLRAVSTSAVREAENKLEFIKTVFEQTGISIDVIMGTEEANLIFLGMKNALPINDKSILGIDIGGGSTEFIYGVKGVPIFTESVNIGAVRLSKKFFPDFIITNEAVLDCFNYVEQQIKLNININTNLVIDFAVGSSGTVDTICLIKELKNYPKTKPRLNGYTFNKTEFEEIFSFVMNLKNPADRASVPGIEANRADIIPAGLIILKKIFELFKIEKMILSEYALREGIVFDLISRSN